MVKCPTCKKEAAKPEKMWKYAAFDVLVFTCSECGTKFRDYSQKGKHSFTLKQQKGRRCVKV